ncbi:MAG: HDOD domain-containing protein [Planctomycetaceae bacterium]|nr:HDOD domain-containing protein [Planctomycetaceae bacterium]
MNQPEILFVDDEPNILGGIRRMLRTRRNEWGLHYASSGQEALSIMDQNTIDIVISDMRMPHMDGADLLNIIAQRHPDTVRIILSGHAEQDAIMRAIPVSHYYLSKPCESDVLTNHIFSAINLRKRVQNKNLRQMVSRLAHLPAMPETYQKICDIVRSDQAGVKDAIKVINNDSSMAVHILKLVNSSYFGLARHISDIGQAVALLGFETLKSLVLTVGIFRENRDGTNDLFNHAELTDHSIACGQLARHIAMQITDEREVCDDAFTAGLLHDIGKLVMATGMPEEYGQAVLLSQKDRIPLFEAEQRCYGYNHADVSGYLLGIWNLPDSITNAVAYHHDIETVRRESSLVSLAVYSANCMVNEKSHDHQACLSYCMENDDSEPDDGVYRDQQMEIWQQLLFMMPPEIS